MNDIQQLIDRYLADGLSADELARLSRAVHRDDVPQDWLIIREMIDSLSEGEEDYDLMMAVSRGSTSACVEKMTSTSESVSNEAITVPSVPARANNSSNRAKGRKWVAVAASVLVFAVIGVTLFFINGRVPQFAVVDEIEPGTSASAPDSASPSALSSGEDQGAAPLLAETTIPETQEPKASVPVASAAEISAVGASVAGAPASRVRPAAYPAVATAQSRSVARAKQPDEAPFPDASPDEVQERRIYSCNLLDQIPENYEAPAHATDEY